MSKPVINPPWITKSMTIDHAAREASMRGFYLKAFWNQNMGGLRLVAIPKEQGK